MNCKQVYNFVIKFNFVHSENDAAIPLQCSFIAT